MSAVVALCAGASVMAQVNDAAPDAGAFEPDRQIRVGPESLGDPVAGPFNVELGANIDAYGVVHAFGHYWVTASRRDPIAHAIWKFDEDGRFIKAFEQAPGEGGRARVAAGGESVAARRSRLEAFPDQGHGQGTGGLESPGNEVLSLAG